MTLTREMTLNRISESRNRQRGNDDVLQEFGTVYPVRSV